MYQQSESVKEVHDHKLAVRRCSCSAFSYFANVSRFGHSQLEIVVDKIKSACEPLLVKCLKDSLNYIRFLLPAQTIYLLVCDEGAYGYDDYLSECRYRRELLPD